MHKTTFLFLTFTLGCCTTNFAQNNHDRFCHQISGLKNLVKTSHYAPKTIDDSLSKGVFKLFIKHLDTKNRLFTKAEYDSFRKDIFLLDDYINNNTCDFIDVYAKAVEKRIEVSKRFLNDLAETTLDYSGKDTLYFGANNTFSYFKNNTEAKKYWSKRVRYNILTSIIEDSISAETIKSKFKSLESNIKQKIIDKEICLLNELKNKEGGIKQFVQHAFLSAFLNYHDPHSTFFSNSEKDYFEHALGNDQMSFGISTLKNENGDIIISYIVPGSPAFKNANLEVNDIIKSIRADKDELEAYCISNDEVLKFLNTETYNEATFKIKKASGLIKNIKLTKSLVKNEENTITGYLLNKADNTLKAGYIKIPSFYTDFESVNGLGMANDVAKEIYKLKKDSIQGLVIDLRFNGGGSIKEAMDLSGMFIDRGPLIIMKYNSGETFTLKDSKRGSVFNAPLIVLVNQFSASASELFASVMQDYNRAVIVGTNTHGKSSAQVILPLDETKDLGFAKLTVERFYRATGKSHQSQGVIPDILLPSLYDDFKTEEQYTAYALSNDSVNVVLKHRPFKKADNQMLEKRSENRISANKKFNLIASLNKSVLEHYINKNTQYALNLENVYSDIDTYKNLWQRYTDNIDAKNDDLIVENTSAITKVLLYNEEQKAQNHTTLKELSNDATIQEALLILNDIINTKQQ